MNSFVYNDLSLDIPLNVKCYGDEDCSIYEAYMLGDISMDAVVNDSTKKKTQMLNDGGIPKRTFIGSRSIS